ncbi:glutamate 5-kinase [Echinicola vietnamensis]|uniref:Glutamate 5-kinase n=1 Tax=Echinicola vietnamensis (strain DSM 17526 / LMG 23754 / KMM 6221) TaxID=926556 RepID=L0G2F4_ECHVK|nr:glutamate 5-kinase [Echinicola vietnamensis]AGA80409.1 glutamate 5-kinase [Echinicola vietnamensis DSM 17526]
MENLSKKPRKIVVKVGSNMLTNHKNRIMDTVLQHLVGQLAELYEDNIMPILITSGSVAAGMEAMGRELSIKDDAVRRQIYSSMGQPRLMRHYYEIFQQYGIRCGQVLATKRDFSPGKHRENMINCYNGLIASGIVPIANEDDTVSLSMSAFSDNDELAALVAELLEADMLIFLTHKDGVFNGPPDAAHTEVLEEVKIDEKTEQYIHDKGDPKTIGRGNMASKLKMAKKAASKNIAVHIANGTTPNVLLDIVNGKQIGTRVMAN